MLDLISTVQLSSTNVSCTPSFIIFIRQYWKASDKQCYLMQPIQMQAGGLFRAFKILVPLCRQAAFQNNCPHFTIHRCSKTTIFKIKNCPFSILPATYFLSSGFQLPCLQCQDGKAELTMQSTKYKIPCRQTFLLLQT